MSIHDWARKHNISEVAVSELLQLFTPKLPNAQPVPEHTEKHIQNGIRLTTNLTNGLLLRNNSGVLYNERGTPVRYGLGNESSAMNKTFKSSDLIGVTPLQIREPDIGRTWGVFTAIEAKRSGWKYTGTGREVGQQSFISAIRARGGIAGFATSTTEYINLISEFRK